MRTQIQDAIDVLNASLEEMKAAQLEEKQAIDRLRTTHDELQRIRRVAKFCKQNEDILGQTKIQAHLKQVEQEFQRVKDSTVQAMNKVDVLLSETKELYRQLNLGKRLAQEVVLPTLRDRIAAIGWRVKEERIVEDVVWIAVESSGGGTYRSGSNLLDDWFESFGQEAESGRASIFNAKSKNQQ